jgi:hypothetical protein
MKLHQRGVDLLVNLMDAEQHFDEMKPEELRRLISECVVVFGQIVERDVPTEPADAPVAPPITLR